MIDLYYWPTPNGWKITIALEEMALPYKVIAVDIMNGDQFKPEFMAINPNNKIPAIIDHDPPGGGEPITVFESGAILRYLGEKTGLFYPSDLAARVEVDQWLFWQVAGLGPMAGQCHHFRHYAPEKITYGIARYTNEVTRLYRVLETQLSKNNFVSREYSIADMAIWPWIRLWERQGQDLPQFPHLKRWFDVLAMRSAVDKAVHVGDALRRPSA